VSQTIKNLDDLSSSKGRYIDSINAICGSLLITAAAGLRDRKADSLNSLMENHGRYRIGGRTQCRKKATDKPEWPDLFHEFAAFLHCHPSIYKASIAERFLKLEHLGKSLHRLSPWRSTIRNALLIPAS
jgi:hypothetical protein